VRLSETTINSGDMTGILMIAVQALEPICLNSLRPDPTSHEPSQGYGIARITI
jgi:hypothetical protein